MATIEDYRISGTRVTVWDVMHHLDNKWTVHEIAEVFNISSGQVRATVDYIREHEEDVRAVHRLLEERNSRGNPPEVEAKLDEAHEKRLAWLNRRH